VITNTQNTQRKVKALQLDGIFAVIKRQSILTGGYYKIYSPVNDYQDTESSGYFHYQFHTLKFFQLW
jgi:hypothetical protein